MERCPRSSQATAVAAGVAVAVGAGVGYGIWRLQRKRRASAVTAGSGGSRGLRVQLLYGSMTGTSQRWARQLAEELATEACLEHESVSVEDLTTFQFDNLLAAPVPGQPVQVVLVLLSTQADGAPPPPCAHFCTLLEDHVHDFRVSQAA
eukprot:CAMPEP_0179178664 /NCGR_PEP_ID=MMETSP0796-20121207/88393_1 /TAXON_ID=73915 /ORGANISM="Pyrodinium bahamense, Strain pbaha01" /LENGTH=148 /DNA_ID=CAMNT_0020882275 /DNA_START=10 /DNA_END=452 /DNA_ORIENTATION=+